MSCETAARQNAHSRVGPTNQIVRQCIFDAMICDMSMATMYVYQLETEHERLIEVLCVGDLVWALDFKLMMRGDWQMCLSHQVDWVESNLIVAIWTMDAWVIIVDWEHQQTAKWMQCCESLWYSAEIEIFRRCVTSHQSHDLLGPLASDFDRCGHIGWANAR